MEVFWGSSLEQSGTLVGQSVPGALGLSLQVSGLSGCSSGATGATVKDFFRPFSCVWA